ncbi:hypothetical protein BDA96_09G098700 [Sorghum bicolor]|uniref:Uncharacterized protein n=1 Tax=Sorghum bicolor TaxID=4558 RepID=A0A921Q9E3_SORBI|nr:hypothetical protein BDA96_09G098700 [Sorghum bicolor]
MRGIACRHATAVPAFRGCHGQVPPAGDGEEASIAYCPRSPMACVPTGQQIRHVCCYSRQTHGGQVPCSNKSDTSLKGCRKHQRLQRSLGL